MKEKTNGKKKFFCERLKMLRSERRYLQKDVAEKLGVPLSTYANWEQGRTEPSINDIYRIIEIFEIDANELFDINI